MRIEAMIEEAIVSASPRGRIGLMATFALTLTSVLPEFEAMALEATFVPRLAEGALAALNANESDRHDAATVRAAAAFSDCDVIMLARFSLSQGAGSVAGAIGRRIRTTPDNFVRKPRRLLLPAKAA